MTSTESDQRAPSVETSLHVRETALVTMARASALKGGDRESAFRRITETAAMVLDVARVSIWLHDEAHSGIRCADLWEREAGRHTAGLELAAADHPRYFAALDQDRSIAAGDALTDPRTSEFADAYLAPLGIGAMLDAPIRAGGETIGVVCHEHVGGIRQWTPEDQQFAGSVADVVALTIEASERRRAEDALRASEASYRMLVDRALVGIYRSTVDGRFLAVNPALATMLGYDSVDDLLGLNLATDVYADPDERERLIEAYRKSERIEGLETTWRRRNGSFITVRLFGRPLTDAADVVTGFEMVAEDVTERRALEAQLRQAQKMEAVGQLSGGIAHDFNNILTVILASADLIRHGLPQDRMDLRADVEELQEAARRGSDLVRHLLGFSRRSRLTLRPTDLGETITALSKTLPRLIPENIEIRVHIADEVPSARVDAGAVEQIVLNAATNARDAMPDGGALSIAVRTAWLDEHHRRRTGWGKPGRYVLVEVCDSGTGMDKATVERAFEPFFTTKPQGTGTGLGMAMIYGLVNQQDGYVDLQSAPGRGTCIRMYFPATDGTMEARDITPTRPVAAAEAVTILLVEDERAVAATTTRVLRSAGYTVLLARNGKEALETYERHARQIALVVTDVVMPVMGGRALSERLRERGADVQVLFVSGYASERASIGENMPFLHKPWTAGDLLHTVDRLLNRNGDHQVA